MHFVESIRTGEIDKKQEQGEQTSVNRAKSKVDHSETDECQQECHASLSPSTCGSLSPVNNRQQNEHVDGKDEKGESMTRGGQARCQTNTGKDGRIQRNGLRNEGGHVGVIVEEQMDSHHEGYHGIEGIGRDGFGQGSQHWTHGEAGHQEDDGILDFIQNCTTKNKHTKSAYLTSKSTLFTSILGRYEYGGQIEERGHESNESVEQGHERGRPIVQMDEHQQYEHDANDLLRQGTGCQYGFH